MGHPLTDIELNNATILPLCHVASTARKDTGCRDDLDESTLNTPGLFNIIQYHGCEMHTVPTTFCVKLGTYI